MMNEGRLAVTYQTVLYTPQTNFFSHLSTEGSIGRLTDSKSQVEA
ncbi:hypothetical protein GGR92_002051 [Spirosoma lacussanchae]